MVKVHVLVPYTSRVACGAPNFSITAAYRQKVTCKQCTNTPEYKALPNLPRKYQREPGRGKRAHK